MPAIRAATPDDCDANGEVHVAAWRETYAGLLPDTMLAGLSPQRRAAMWRRGLALNDPDRLLLVAEDASGIAGFAACWRPPPDAPLGTDAEVAAIYLLRRAQRQGHGRALMARLFAFMAGRGMNSAGLWVLRENAGARAFYGGLGAVEGASRTEDAAGQPIVEVACTWRPILA
jgi:ribosomal protein S18 acetylase RimI-like enzyme